MAASDKGPLHGVSTCQRHHQVCGVDTTGMSLQRQLTLADPWTTRILVSCKHGPALAGRFASDRVGLVQHDAQVVGVLGDQVYQPDAPWLMGSRSRCPWVQVVVYMLSWDVDDRL
jgi:hypothetical protein